MFFININITQHVLQRELENEKKQHVVLHG